MSYDPENQPEVSVFFAHCNDCDWYGQTTQEMDQAIRDREMHESEFSHTRAHTYSNQKNTDGHYIRID
jgi:hypothetical protein